MESSEFPPYLSSAHFLWKQPCLCNSHRPPWATSATFLKSVTLVMALLPIQRTKLGHKFQALDVFGVRQTCSIQRAYGGVCWAWFTAHQKSQCLVSLVQELRWNSTRLHDAYTFPPNRLWTLNATFEINPKNSARYFGKVNGVFKPLYDVGDALYYAVKIWKKQARQTWLGLNVVRDVWNKYLRISSKRPLNCMFSRLTLTTYIRIWLSEDKCL